MTNTNAVIQNDCLRKNKNPLFFSINHRQKVAEKLSPKTTQNMIYIIAHKKFYKNKKIKKNIIL